MMMCYTGCTNKHMIAQLLAVDHPLQSQIRRYFDYKEYTDDIIQDLSVIILTHNNEESLVNLCVRNEFNFWVFKVLENKRNTPSYYKNYKTNDLQIEESVQQSENNFIYNEEEEHNKYVESIIKNELAKIKNKNWYSEKIFDEYLKFNKECEELGHKFTYEKFGKKLNIEHTSLFKQVQKVKQILKNRLKDEL